jgi:ATP-dependent helicase/nuclease subunit A
LIDADSAPDTQTPGAALRNPLLRPRATRRDRRHYREGRAVAARIRQLVEAGCADYGDVLILMRSRTHLPDYESALRDAGIPYLSADRGTLLQSLEIRDLEALLVVLMTPQDNLSLAQVLRSPVFSLSDADLMLLAAEKTGSWFERLQALSRRLEPAHPVARAARLLEQWHALAGRIPIHDLLQQIFHQANLTARYLAAFPPTEQARLRANLTRFIELALEVDAGRYPTLPRFLERLRQLRSLESEGPSQATPQAEGGQRVRLLTIHASKGLEAPIVFLVDSARDTGGNHGVPTLVRWPAEHDRPSDFLMLSGSRQRDSISRHKAELEQQEERREAANLLYVALTRARNMLVISGCAAARRTTAPSWYEQLAAALRGDGNPAEVWTRSYLEAPQKDRCQPPQETIGKVDERLARPLRYPALWREITPSRSLASEAGIEGDPEGALRGNIVHRLLQLAADRPPSPELEAQVLARVAGEYQLERGDRRLREWWQDVLRVLNAESLAWLMRPAPPRQVYREVPVQFRRKQQTVFGIIDRLVVDAQAAHIVDYKSHRLSRPDDAARLAEHYRPQLELYHEAVRRLWPDREVSAWLLLTTEARLIRLC